MFREEFVDLLVELPAFLPIIINPLVPSRAPSAIVVRETARRIIDLRLLVRFGAKIFDVRLDALSDPSVPAGDMW